MNHYEMDIKKNISIEDLEHFLELIPKGKHKFRYFESRPLSIISEHIANVILFDNDLPVAYAHLDFENCIWLGMAVADEYAGRGFGKEILKILLNEAKKLAIKEIFLTVDSDNTKAINLYKKFGFFYIKEVKNNIYLFKKTNND